MSPEGLKSILKEALNAQSVNMIFGRVIVDVKRSHQSGLGQLLVSTNISEHNFDMVVNCLWEGRSAIDEKFGIEFNSGGNYRFKTGIKFPFMQEYKSLPSVTVVNGAFGDFVQYKERSGMYFSYYPVSRLGMTVNGTQMKSWDDLAEGNFPSQLEDAQVSEHNKAFKNFFSCGQCLF